MDLFRSLNYAAQDFLRVRPKGKRGTAASRTSRHHVLFLGDGASLKTLKSSLSSYLSQWQLAEIADSKKPILSFDVKMGVVWVLRPRHFESENETLGHEDRLKYSLQGRARDLAGAWLRGNKVEGGIRFEFASAKDEEVRGALIGLGLASYSFLSAVRQEPLRRSWEFFDGAEDSPQPIQPKLLDEATALYQAMNFARHLTNMPAGEATPARLCEGMTRFLRGRPNLKIEVWNEQRLRREKMGLLFGVGKSSRINGPRFVHLRYRPKSREKKPIAFVGKGVTFDSGGLDIKPSSAMRLMKKDMAGVALVAGLCHFVTTLKLDRPCDFYLPLAENSVSDTATRPGDVHRARSGHLVEIDNTDAEGRLVMADAIDVAVTQGKADQPEVLFDVSTLTGAMRVALGLDVAGFFSNNDRWSKKVENAAQRAGELAWRMPLVQKYKRQLHCSFADFKNSTDSGFGGAITAALFLEKFVRNTPWVHFDVMSWNTSGDAAISEGANAQCLQILANLLVHL